MKFFTPNSPIGIIRSLDKKYTYPELDEQNYEEENIEELNIEKIEIGYYSQSYWYYIFYIFLILSPNLLWLIESQSKSVKLSLSLICITMLIIGGIKLINTTIYIVTENEFVIYSKSFLNRPTAEVIPYERIRSLEQKRSFIQNFLGLGTFLLKIEGDIEWEYKVVGLNKEDFNDLFSGLQKITQDIQNEEIVQKVNY
jgi:hypothetical protein